MKFAKLALVLATATAASSVAVAAHKFEVGTTFGGNFARTTTDKGVYGLVQSSSNNIEVPQADLDKTTALQFKTLRFSSGGYALGVDAHYVYETERELSFGIGLEAGVEVNRYRFSPNYHCQLIVPNTDGTLPENRQVDAQGNPTVIANNNGANQANPPANSGANQADPNHRDGLEDGAKTAPIKGTQLCGNTTNPYPRFSTPKTTGTDGAPNRTTATVYTGFAYNVGASLLFKLPQLDSVTPYARVSGGLKVVQYPDNEKTNFTGYYGKATVGFHLTNGFRLEAFGGAAQVKAPARADSELNIWKTETKAYNYFGGFNVGFQF